MQSIMLDTNAALWFFFNPARLGKLASRMIENTREVSMSAISLAELEIKSINGNLKMPPLSNDLLGAAQIEVKPFAQSASYQIARFGGLDKHDPFDRLLLAHAAAENALFVTGDAVLLAQKLDFVIDAEA